MLLPGWLSFSAFHITLLRHSLQQNIFDGVFVLNYVAELSCCLLHSGFLLGLFLHPEDWRGNPPKLRLTFAGLHGLISQKTEHFLHYSYLTVTLTFVHSWLTTMLTKTGLRELRIHRSAVRIPKMQRNLSPTAVSHVRSQFRSCAICGGRRGTGASFLPVLVSPIGGEARRKETTRATKM
jgi:hypothetical protein